jgi:hypothetical protein
MRTVALPPEFFGQTVELPFYSCFQVNVIRTAVASGGGVGLPGTGGGTSVPVDLIVMPNPLVTATQTIFPLRLKLIDISSVITNPNDLTYEIFRITSGTPVLFTTDTYVINSTPGSVYDVQVDNFPAPPILGSDTYVVNIKEGGNLVVTKTFLVQ